jgi:hypothetical protein
VVRRLGEREPGVLRDERDDARREAVRGVDAGADRRAAERELREPLDRGLDPGDAVADLLRVIGVASMRCVRPDFTTPANSPAFASSDSASTVRLGTSSLMRAPVAAMWIDDGKVSFDDCEALTWSFGWIFSPDARDASVATTSLVFMFELVPDPVWKTSIGNSPSCVPAMTSSAAATMASAIPASSTPSSLFARAAARLTSPSAWMWCAVSVFPEMGKFSTARCV